MDVSARGSLFKEKGGAPNKSIKLMISILIFMAIEKLTWREAEFQFLRRIDWMIATSTALGDAFIDFTTLRDPQSLRSNTITS